MWFVDQQYFPILLERQNPRLHPELLLSERLHFNEIPGDAGMHQILGRAGLEGYARQGSSLEMRMTPPQAGEQRVRIGGAR